MCTYTYITTTTPYANTSTFRYYAILTHMLVLPTINLRRHAVSPHALILPTIKSRPKTTHYITSRTCTVNYQQTRQLHHSIYREILLLSFHRGYKYLQIDIMANLRQHAVSPYVLVLPTMNFRQHSAYYSSSYCKQPFSNKLRQHVIYYSANNEPKTICCITSLTYHICLPLTTNEARFIPTN